MPKRRIPRIKESDIPRLWSQRLKKTRSRKPSAVEEELAVFAGELKASKAFLVKTKEGKIIVRRKEGGSQDSREGYECNPFMRKTASDILNILHEEFPKLFPQTLKITAMRFNEKGGVEFDSEFKPTLKRPANADKLAERYWKTLEEAGFQGEWGVWGSDDQVFDHTDDVGFVREGQKTRPFFFEVYRVSFLTLSKFLARKGIKLKPASMRKLMKAKKELITGCLNKGLKSPDKFVRESSLRELAFAGDKKLFSFFKEKANSKNPKTRKTALLGLGRISGEQAFSIALKNLEHADSEVRTAAVTALRYMGNKKAIPFLKERLAVVEGRLAEDDVFARREILRTLKAFE